MSTPRSAWRLRTVLTLCATALLATAAPAAAEHEPDPLLADQWALADGAIGVPEAWQQVTGAGVVVAVLDTGVQLDHPDLRENIWRNPGEVAGNGIDDDGNGIADDVHGVDLVNGDATPADDQGHGTHVAGTIAAGRNRVGGAGVAPSARIMAVKVLDNTNAGTWTNLAEGIRYAVREGARVINVSINGQDRSRAVADAVAEAGRAGVLIVASAGNDGRDIDAAPSFPASLPDENIVAVTASTEQGGPWGRGNRGAVSVDLAAPGEQILSTANGSEYELRSGTSMAAPHVAGALALLASARPDASATGLRAALLDSARRTRELDGRVATGRLDVAGALRRVVPGPAARQAVAGTTQRAAKRRPALRAAKRVRHGSRVSVRWDGTSVERVVRWRVSLDNRVVARLRAKERMRVHRVMRAGRHRWGVVGYDARGRRVTSASFRLQAVRR